MVGTAKVNWMGAAIKVTVDNMKTKSKSKGAHKSTMSQHTTLS